MGAALDLGGAVPPPLPDLRDVLSLNTQGVIPPDPRDHTVLETIYNEMHAERWINLAPLSLLANTVGLWFNGESLSFILSFSGGRSWQVLMMGAVVMGARARPPPSRVG
jgi:hypothetical protein